MLMHLRTYQLKYLSFYLCIFELHTNDTIAHGGKVKRVYAQRLV